ncbi:class I SAM-dependent methyltransferase [Acidaminococcus sp. AM05-11]|uniref:class I SAM-dependent methyltransferase n=1 Tax=Acidaminococcus sp. AM05-11 TaxID=2291997 RepID=UPI000E511A09|nr:class I SAM-dependent methyltransferase [Acidaminococcus sp. AM05-11]RHK00937.1 class I SAM-dependent methyltransferase [Acidaminococcus sp. AM05-11]
MSNKYNFEFDKESKRDPLAIINKKIKAGSKILEFGPANGRFTKYLKNQKECCIDIVEYDFESGVEASQYALVSCIGPDEGDIEKENWCKKLKGNKYDAIIFADVLEHLRDPLSALKKCHEFLKNNGQILLSVPNIAHNSILINLYLNKFNYTSVGILDNTHIHFFTYNSLIQMVKDAGYYPVYQTAVKINVGDNEIDAHYSDLEEITAAALKEREKTLGLVYQYVFQLKQVEDECVIDLNNQDNIYLFKCYIKENDDTDFSEDKAITIKLNEGINNIKIDLNKYKSLSKIRLDPMELGGEAYIHCTFLSNNNNAIPAILSYSNGILVKPDTYFFEEDDPQLVFDVDNLYVNTIAINICVKQFSKIDKLKYISSFYKREYYNKKQEIASLRAIIQEKDIKIENIMHSKSWRITQPFRTIAKLLKK